MRLPEVHPDADSTRRVDLELAILLDVLELARAGVVKNEHHGGQTARQVDFAVQKLRNGYGPVTFVVDELEIAGKVSSLASVASVCAVDQMVLDDGDAAELVWNPAGVLSRSARRRCRCSGATRRGRGITCSGGIAGADGR